MRPEVWHWVEMLLDGEWMLAAAYRMRSAALELQECLEYQIGRASRIRERVYS